MGGIIGAYAYIFFIELHYPKEDDEEDDDAENGNNEQQRRLVEQEGKEKRGESVM